MEDEVKFIFKTLIKVPCLIFIAYFIMNVFFFFFVYFKVLGVSYVVMQTAVENNYLPTQELNTLLDYVDTLNDIPMVDNSAKIVVRADGFGINSSDPNAGGIPEGDARLRRQYGGTVTCGVSCGFHLIWPLSYHETTVDNKGVKGLNDSTFSGFADKNTLRDRRNDKKSNDIIKITYTVPGLKYYPDLRTH